jgi:hypothetical protein
MSTLSRWLPALLAFVVGLALAGWWGTSEDWKRWDREQRQPLLDSIAALAPAVAAQQLVNQTLLARLDSAARVRPPIERPAPRPPVIDPPLPPSDASASAWRGAAMDARAALATEREGRDRTERNWALYGERARIAEAMIDTLRTELAASDSLLTEQAALLRQSEVVLMDAPKPKRAWVTVSAEALALLQGGRVSGGDAEAGPGRWQVGGRILAVEAAIGPGKWQVIGRAESATGTGERLAVGVRRAIRVF